MGPGILVPLAAFAAVILIVALSSVSKMHDRETEVRQRLYAEEVEHQRKMKELELTLERVRRGE